jgi:hypothetical protein
MFALASVLSAVFFLLDYRLLLWRRRGVEVDGDRIWNDLRLFSGWMCAGCVAGIVVFVLSMHGRNLAYETRVLGFGYESIYSGMNPRQQYLLRASSLQYFAARDIFYPIHLLCVISAMITLLRRVSDHASHSYYNTARDNDAGRMTGDGKFDCRDCIGQYALYYWVRSMHRIAMVICSLNVVARVVSAGLYADTAALYYQAAAATDSTGLDTSNSQDIFKNRVVISMFSANASVAVSQFFEATVLVFVASGFLLFFPAIIVMFRRVEHRMGNFIREMHLRSDHGTAFLPLEFSPRAADGSKTQTEMPVVDARLYLRDLKSSASSQRRRFLFCLLFVLAALVALASYAVFLASLVINATRNPNADCSICDSSCQTPQYVAGVWYVHTPEWFPLNASLGATLPLLLSLWLMTTPEDRALLLHPGRHRSDSTALQPPETKEARLRAERIRMGVELQ